MRRPRRSKKEMNEVKRNVVSFIRDNGGKAMYSEISEYIQPLHDFNDRQMTNLLYRMHSVWSELKFSEGVYTIGENKVVSTSPLNSGYVVTDIKNDLKMMVEDYRDIVAEE